MDAEKHVRQLVQRPEPPHPAVGLAEYILRGHHRTRARFHHPNGRKTSTYVQSHLAVIRAGDGFKKTQKNSGVFVGGWKSLKKKGGECCCFLKII